MLRDRKELEENLKQSIENIKYKRKNVEQINKNLSQYVGAGFFNEIAKNTALLEEIDTDILALISIAVFEIDSTDGVRAESYFTENELKEAKKHKIESKAGISLPFTIPNVLQIDLENYVTSIKFTEVVKWNNSNIIVYDFETQRSPKFKRGRDGVVPTPDINIESVKAIAENMLNETYLPDMITLNVYSEEEEPISYNAKNNELTIKDGTTVSILDGFHRLQGAARAVAINPELNQDIILSIRTYDTDTAKKYFGQINTLNVVKRERLEELKQEKISYVAVKQLQRNSDLKGKIASGSRVSELAGQLTTSDVLANAIEDVFEPKNTFEARELGTYLTDFFNYLLGKFSDEFESNDSILKHFRMFAGYIVIAKQFKDNDISLNRLNDVIEHINNKENIKEVVTNNRGSSSRLQKQVRDYFQKNVNVLNILNLEV
ncbi:DNA sulfur modification protein DndB [Paenibacillus medicaginis]|uniref:DNA sulfur modification protein DndB n=1 Tax=Paenibacillus medicaginis TaxID=1470560 RepID=A0ABV5BUR7_9BACL